MRFFEGKEEELYKELESWVGVPFRHRQGTRAGVDCIHLIGRVLEHFGYGPFKFPDYALDWHLHKTSGLMMTQVRKQLPNTEEVKLKDIQNGDILFWHVGKDIGHVGMYFEDHGDRYIYHAVRPFGVLKIRWETAMKFKNQTNAITHILRLLI